MKTYCICLIFLFAAFGCAGKGKSPSEISKSKDEIIYQLDVNRDGKIDCLWAQNVKDKNTPSTLWRKDDLNFDGKFDIEQFYTDGKLTLEKMDLDFDQVFDLVNSYENGLLSKAEFSLSPTGKTDMWLYYKEGKLIKKEVDRRHTGKPDYFEFYKDSKLERIGRDLDGDGIIDIWE